ncbi:MAG: hypothetical protein COB54_00145 [Alphaproteobacteria bacterium]|nr:MAG: hypothetical protein COB54_00145 [Alphaproteobacteria bacterium]
MKRICLFIPFLLLVFLINPVAADETGWTEKKLGKVILKAGKAARHKKWSRAIKYGEQVLLGCKILGQHSNIRYINQLSHLNQYYDKANRLKEVPSRVKEAYNLSGKHLGPAHDTTIVSRQLYYKLLLTGREYHQASLLVLESISILGESEEDKFQLHGYLKSLYSLYGLTGQLEQEENTLLHFIQLHKQLVGNDDNDITGVIVILAKNYCRQKKLDKFNHLINFHGLKYSCK